MTLVGWARVDAGRRLACGFDRLAVTVFFLKLSLGTVFFFELSLGFSFNIR